MLPSWLILDPLIQSWLLEDIGRGDRTTQGLHKERSRMSKAVWITRQPGVIAGLEVAARVFQLLDSRVTAAVSQSDGCDCQSSEIIVRFYGPLEALLTGERVALNLAMRLSGVATLTRQYVAQLSDVSAQLVDTRKTTPGLRILEKYATLVGGAVNHRMGLDDAVMIKDNHIAAAGGIEQAVTQIRASLPYPLSIEVETETLEQVKTALGQKVDIIMLDNMSLEEMKQAVELIRKYSDRVKIEASGNVTLETIRAVAETGVDYISTSAPITQATWLDISMRLDLE
ncbi:MAG: carboxylating nicotinate-nucleotide diphosphorylase [Leptolyngbyaceae cyanobacterium SM1_1_3]|nr:carboxylating nicotinate-nucleotide diphosphorylase [Leptolyngbyaceae cyanobacterium SM1_1_3]NJN01112.1 carboxylating nicotinate-nucleotide diphosphorylase [Leptolyngbyaceae cyanobacterium RM1_1_2]NJO10777.1 carboxylating nicotinate-nucleotide diphosphorylase [Leptolyngbyaceae cyanobacterium SL_1_1]